MFKKKNAQKFVVVHRDHDDPDYYNDDENGHVFLPVDDLNKQHQNNKPSSEKNNNNNKNNSNVLGGNNKSTTESNKPALFGIGVDTSKYDYSQHLKPIGQSPNAIFVPAKFGRNNKNNKSYLRHQQNIEDSISGFKPDLNPDLREVLEALEDEAYVVNEDIEVVKPSKKTKEIKDDNEDDIFAELLEGGEVDEDDNAYLFDDHENLYREDEWDIENEMNNYEDEHYLEENDNILAQVNKLDDLHQIGYQDDVKRFQDEQKKQKNLDYIESDNEFLSDDDNLEEEEENDTLGDLPTINNNKKSAIKSGKNKKKQRHRKGAMSDVSGFSMSSSAIARTETMTVLDDSYDNIIGGYENYQEELEEDEDYKPFNMAEERSDFESMLDDFLDNYELESGGRKLVKKDPELQKYKDAADKVTKGKLSMRRNRERQKEQNNKDVNNISNSLSSLKF